PASSTLFPYTTLFRSGALAAALNIELAVLMEAPITGDKLTPAKSRLYKLWGAISVMGSVLVALGWWSSAAAEQVMVSLSIEASRSEEHTSELQSRENL